MRELNTKEMLNASGGHNEYADLAGMYIGFQAGQSMFAFDQLATGMGNFNPLLGGLIGAVAGRALVRTMEEVSDNWVEPTRDTVASAAKIK